jgi:hypothetical protein
MDTSHLKKDVKQELFETKEEMVRLRQEVQTFKNPGKPTSGAWSKHNADVYRGQIATSADIPSLTGSETLTPRPLRMLKPVAKNTMSFRSFSAEDYQAVYVEISPCRFSQIRTDLHAAGVDTKKIINISFINGRTAEFVVQTNYAQVFKTIIGKELFVHHKFDASHPMDQNAPESVVLAFKKSFAIRIQNIIANSSIAVVRQFYEKMAQDNGTFNFVAEKETYFPEASAIERILSGTRGEGQQKQRSADSDCSTPPREQDSITSEELRLLKVKLVQDTPVHEFPEYGRSERAQTSTGKGKEPAIEIDLEEETDKSPKLSFPAKKQNVETLMGEDFSEDTDVEVVSKNPTSRKLRRLFQKLEYSSLSSNATETNEDENMDLSQ